MVGQLFAKLADSKLGKEIEAKLPRLFAERSAQLVPNEDREYSAPRAFGHSVATVITREFTLRFTRVPDELAVEVSPRGDRVTAASRVESARWAYDGGAEFDWTAVDRFLSEHWERLTGVSST